jgi:hypothetical protein
LLPRWANEWATLRFFFRAGILAEDEDGCFNDFIGDEATLSILVERAPFAAIGFWDHTFGARNAAT